jgi:hypothetical protein
MKVNLRQTDGRAHVCMHSAHARTRRRGRDGFDSGGSREAGGPERRWPNDAEYGLFHDGVAGCNRFANGSSVGGGRIFDALGAGCAVSADRSVGPLSAEWFLLTRRAS